MLDNLHKSEMIFYKTKGITTDREHDLVMQLDSNSALVLTGPKVGQTILPFRKYEYHPVSKEDVRKVISRLAFSVNHLYETFGITKHLESRGRGKH